MFPTEDGKWFSFLPSGFCELVSTEDRYWLEWLAPCRGRILSEHLLTEFIQNCPHTCREALEDLGLIKNIEIRSPLINGVQVLTDVPERLQPLLTALAECLGTDIGCFSDPEELQRGLGLTIVFYDHYRESNFRQLMNMASQISCVVQCAYRLDHCFYIDNPYLPNIGNPDHFSCRENLQSTHKNASGREGIYGLFDFFERECPAAVPAFSIGEIEYAFISWLIFQQFRKLLGIADEMFRSETINKALSVDLIRSRIYQTPVSHYECHVSETF